uniref:Uncharacterized protein n=1 Tax=Cucumis melo TaxID=3656 RepID=A0A9I9D7G7_CUCME
MWSFSTYSHGPSLLILFTTSSLLGFAFGGEGFCSAPSIVDSDADSKALYYKVTNPTLSPSHLQEWVLNSTYVESAVEISQTNTLGAYLITPAIGSHFVMYLAQMKGAAKLTNSSGITEKLTIVGSTDKQPLLETPGELRHLKVLPCVMSHYQVFQLRKLLPMSMPYDFNVHIMDFEPGEFLNVKEVHYNQHGLLLLEGQVLVGTLFNLVMPFGWLPLYHNG